MKLRFDGLTLKQFKHLVDIDNQNPELYNKLKCAYSDSVNPFFASFYRDSAKVDLSLEEVTYLISLQEAQLTKSTRISERQERQFVLNLLSNAKNKFTSF